MTIQWQLFGHFAAFACENPIFNIEFLRLHHQGITQVQRLIIELLAQTLICLVCYKIARWNCCNQ